MFDTIQEDTTPKDDSKDSFYIVACDKPKESYKPYRDVLLVDFVLVCPPHTNIYVMWIGRAFTTMQLARNHC